MRRALSSSLVAPAVILSEVCLTMPSIGNELRCRRVELAIGGGERRRVAGLRQIEGAVARGELARHLDDGRFLVLGPCDVQELGAVLGIALDLGLAVGRPGAAGGAEPLRLAECRQRHPRLHRAGGLGDLQPRHRLEGAPRTGLGSERALREAPRPAMRVAAAAAAPAFKTSRLFIVMLLPPCRCSSDFTSV